MDSALMAATFGLAGIIIGGAIQFWLTRYFDNKRFQREIRRSAYEKYLRGISQLSFVPDDNDAHLAALAIIAEARGQIALCGSDEVIMRMNRVFQHGNDLYAANAREDIQALILAMRRDSLGSSLSEMETELFLMMYGDGPGGNRS